ncbi:deaminase [Pontibacillus salicampi]|uniref:deaminase n=1 Tax=Pontibacillus salicampi TaxID=1449801 RepID=UPI00366FEDF6
MKWSNVPELWQECFRVAWDSFQDSSRPVGAVVINEKDEIVGRGKSASFEMPYYTVINHNDLARAEINALLKLDKRIHTNLEQYMIMSTLEPCPLSYGAIYMSGIRHIHFAALNGRNGSMNVNDATPFLSQKPVNMSGPKEYLEDFSIVLNVYYDLTKSQQKHRRNFMEMERYYPEAASIAKEWKKTDRLDQSSHLTVGKVYTWFLEDIEKNLKINA